MIASSPGLRRRRWTGPERARAEIDILDLGYIVIDVKRFAQSVILGRSPRQCIGEACCLLLVVVLLQPRAAEAQPTSDSAGDCGVAICLQTGMSNWRYAATQYCEAEVCLRDSLEGLVALDWDRMLAGQLTLFSTAANPYIGLTNGEYQRLRALRDNNLQERIALLAKVRGSCKPAELRLRLDVPGYDLVEVTFAMPSPADGGGHGFQATQIRRTYRQLPGGSVGWWVRWISYRFPGITLMRGPPTEFANYEIGLYMGGLVLFDKEFAAGTPDDYLSQPACVAH